MFGLKDKSDKRPDEFLFDLEVELNDPNKQVELLKLVEQRLQSLKTHIRAGENKEDFNKFGRLLHGYAALIKVITKATQKKKA
jgi:hypothetical protein